MVGEGEGGGGSVVCKDVTDLAHATESEQDGRRPIKTGKGQAVVPG